MKTLSKAAAVVGLLIASAGLFWPVELPAQSSDICPVAGRYWLVGKMPGSSSEYRGRLTISRNNGACRVKWDPPNESEGTGTFDNGVLTVNFRLGSESGVAVYTRSSDGQLVGKWWLNSSPDAKGFETLSLSGPPRLVIEPFSTPIVSTEGARVGYHLDAAVKVRQSERPSACDYYVNPLSYQGSLPPGVSFQAGAVVPFSGTPRQPGSWSGFLDVEFQCTSGSDTGIYRRSIRVTFDVAP